MYTTATVTNKFTESDGRLRLDVTYTGNSGEAPVVLPIYVLSTALPSADEFRGQAMSKLSILNTTQSVLASITLPVVLDTTTPLPTSTPTFQRHYTAASLPFTPGATPQDVFMITGSATKTISVLYIGISTTQTTAGVNTWLLLERSTANSAGTSAVVPSVQSDNNVSAATAVVRQYTANPTAGTLVGRIWTGRVVSPAPATVGVGDLEKAIEFPSNMPSVLSGVGQVLALNFNGAALPPGLSVTASVRWMEV